MNENQTNLLAHSMELAAVDVKMLVPSGSTRTEGPDISVKDTCTWVLPSTEKP